MTDAPISSYPITAEVRETVAKIDHLLAREEHDSGYAAFVYMRKIWPELKGIIDGALKPGDRSELSVAQNQYIQLLEDYSSDLFSLAYAHGYRCPEEKVELGASLRAKIASLKIGEQWQPIETAPRDGTQVLVWFRGRQHVAEYAAIFHRDNTHWCVRDPATGERDISHTVHQISPQTIDGKQIPGMWLGPTHWKPLDDGPTENNADAAQSALPSTASTGDAQKPGVFPFELCEQVANEEFEREIKVIEDATNDKALSDTGRASIRALADASALTAQRIASRIRALALISTVGRSPSEGK